LPLLTEAGGQKLAKSRRSVPVDPTQAPDMLSEVLQKLAIELPVELKRGPVEEQLQFAIARWNPAALTGLAAIELPP
jgi:hypothetical protein